MKTAMPTRVFNHVLLLAALCAGGCGQRNPAPPNQVPAGTPAAAPTAPPLEPAAEVTTPPPGNARSSVYTGLEDCRLFEARPDEAGYRLSECKGPAGHVLRVIESDGRFNVMVQVPGGRLTSLRLSELGGGAFSQLGERIEWRGQASGEAGSGETFVPDVLVLRHAVADDVSRPSHHTSYLVLVALGGKAACVAGRIKPGAGQGEQARRLADAAPGCLARE